MQLSEQQQNAPYMLFMLFMYMQYMLFIVEYRAGEVVTHIQLGCPPAPPRGSQCHHGGATTALNCHQFDKTAFVICCPPPQLMLTARLHNFTISSWTLLGNFPRQTCSNLAAGIQCAGPHRVGRKEWLVAPRAGGEFPPVWLLSSSSSSCPPEENPPAPPAQFWCRENQACSAPNKLQRRPCWSGHFTLIKSLTGF